MGYSENLKNVAPEQGAAPAKESERTRRVLLISLLGKVPSASEGPLCVPGRFIALLVAVRRVARRGSIAFRAERWW